MTERGEMGIFEGYGDHDEPKAVAVAQGQPAKHHVPEVFVFYRREHMHHIHTDHKVFEEWMEKSPWQYPPAECEIVRYVPDVHAERAPDSVGDLVKLAAELHRAKWQFDVNDEMPLSAKEGRKLAVRAFEELHRIGDLALKMRDEAKRHSPAASEQEPVGYGYSAEIQSAPGDLLHVCRKKIALYDTPLYLAPLRTQPESEKHSMGQGLALAAERLRSLNIKPEPRG